MKNIFDNVKDDFSLFEDTKDYIVNNYIDAVQQVDDKIKVAINTLDESCVQELTHLFNNTCSFEANDERKKTLNNFAFYVLKRLLDFYLEKSQELISEYHLSLYLIVDLIDHNPEILSDDLVIRQFVDASYPMLLTKDKVPQSELDLAIYKFISMLAFNEDIKDGRLLLRQFIAKEPLCPYTSDAKDALKRARN